MERFVELIGDRHYLEELSKVLITPELCITQEGKNFYLKSNEFNLLNKDDEVLRKAEKLISEINGAAKIKLQMQSPLKAGCVVEARGNGTRRVSFRADTRINVIGSHDKPDPIPKWLLAARNDPDVAYVLRLYVIDTGWFNLYNVLERVIHDVGGIRNIEKNGWATKAEIRRFKHTSRSICAIGDKARHGVEKTKPPKSPMLLSEAKALIRRICNNWLNSKV